MENNKNKIIFIIKHDSEYETDVTKFINWTESFIGDSLDCTKRYQIAKNYKESKIEVIFEEQFGNINVPFNEKLFYRQCYENDILWSVKIIIE
jgi:hypothetical protein